MLTHATRQMLPSSGYDRYDGAALLLLVGLAGLVLLTFRCYGISNDEGLQQRYGELIIAYYASGFADRSLFAFDNLYLYGGLFDVLATLIAKLVPLDLYHVRHLLCAFVGVGGIAATWATARLIAGSRAALIAAGLLAVTGVWYGAMFNHTKDITFAAAMMAASYWLIKVARDLPYPRLRDVLAFGAMLGAALGLRAMGLLLGLYLVAAILLKLHDGAFATNRERFSFVGRSLLAFMPGLLLGCLIMLAVWPWAALHPFNPVRAIFEFAQFRYPIRDLLAGQTYAMDAMPRWYLPAYLAIKLPLAMWCGVAIALVFAAMPRLAPQPAMTRMRREVGFIATMAVVPVAAQVIGHGPGFSGMRHFTFVVPLLAVLAAVAFDVLIAALARWRVAAIAAGVAVVASLTGTAASLARLHPHEYLFYNSIVGGLSGAAGRYATDYWVNVMPEAVQALQSYVARVDGERGAAERHYNVAICAQRVQFERTAMDRLHWTDTWEEAHFFIAPTHMACDSMLEGTVIATVERMGVVIGVVKDRRAIIGQDDAPYVSPCGQYACISTRIP